MVTKKIIAPLLLMILVAGIGGIFAAKNYTKGQMARTAEASQVAPPHETQSQNKVAETAPVASKKNYADFSESALADSSYENTVLFFHAAWCPECRAFDKALASSTIPENTRILKVNYDDSTQLKKKYGVTLQSTFILIDTEDKLVRKWAGYGKEKNAETVLTNLGL